MMEEKCQESGVRSQEDVGDMVLMNLKTVERVYDIPVKTLYSWINDGRLRRGVHYIKPTRRPLIIKEEFYKHLLESDGRM
jgi:predicted site-specific integrase-resolvase